VVWRRASQPPLNSQWLFSRLFREFHMRLFREFHMKLPERLQKIVEAEGDRIKA